MRPSVRSRSKLLVLLAAVLVGAARSHSVATMPVSRMDTPWWRQRFQEKQAELEGRQVDLVWLGDSITQDWERDGPQAWQDFAPVWKQYYGDRHAVNLGFKGDSTCHVLWRIRNGELSGLHPKALILLIGANNFGHLHTDAGQTYKGIALIVGTLHRALPATQILLIGVLPSIRSAWVTRNTLALNRRLEQLPASQGGWLHYVDLGSIFERDGRIDPERFLDPHLRPPDPPLHPTAFAQAAMAAAIEPIVSTMMHDRPHRGAAPVK